MSVCAAQLASGAAYVRRWKLQLLDLPPRGLAIPTSSKIGEEGHGTLLPVDHNSNQVTFGLRRNQNLPACRSCTCTHRRRALTLDRRPPLNHL